MPEPVIRLSTEEIASLNPVWTLVYTNQWGTRRQENVPFLTLCALLLTPLGPALEQELATTCDIYHGDTLRARLETFPGTPEPTAR